MPRAAYLDRDLRDRIRREPSDRRQVRLNDAAVRVRHGRKECRRDVGGNRVIRAAIGTICESEVLNQVYQMMPSMNFSSAILARCPDKLLVLPIRKVLWSDWGRAERILATLTQLRIQTPALAREGARFKATASTAGML